MRLQYASNDPPSDDPAAAAIYEAVSARRAPRPLQSLDLTLLRAPHLAAGWNSFLGAVRSQTSLSADVRELAICRVAVLNEAAVEWKQHAPLLRKDGGFTDEKMKAIICAKYLDKAGDGDRGVDESILEARHWAVVEYTDQMTRKVKVDDAVFEKLKGHFNEREIVELTTTIAAYNCVSRFLVALDVGESNGQALSDWQ